MQREWVRIHLHTYIHTERHRERYRDICIRNICIHTYTGKHRETLRVTQCAACSAQHATMCEEEDMWRVCGGSILVCESTRYTEGHTVRSIQPCVRRRICGGLKLVCESTQYAYGRIGIRYTFHFYRRDRERETHRQTERETHTDAQTERHTETHRVTQAERHRHTQRHTGTETQRETKRETHRPTDRQTNRSIGRQRERQTETWMWI
jgi:hypothetical protein